MRQPSCSLCQGWDGRAIGPLQQVDHPRQLAARSGRGRLGVFADGVRSRGIGLVRRPLRLRRLAWLDRPFRSLVDSDCFQTGSGQFERVTLAGVVAAQTGIPAFALISRTKPSLMNLALTLLRPAPFIESGTTKQRSPRCAAAVIITSCASVSLTLMIQPFLSSRRLGRSGPLTRTSPGSAKANGAVGSRALAAPRLTAIPMLPFERKASRFCEGGAIVLKSPDW